MPNTAARIAIPARRNELARFTVAVVGIDLTGVTMAMQVRPTVDNPVLLFALGTVNTLAAEGLKLDSVTVTNGVPTSIIKGRINASTMTDPTKVPYMGEVGTDSLLAYAMQWTLNGDPQTRLYGDFIVVGSAFGSDNAPASRPPSYGSTSVAGASTSGSLTFGDQIIQIILNGAEFLAPLVQSAKDAVAAVQVAAGVAQAARDEAVAVGTVPAALAAAQSILPPQDMFQPDRVQLGKYYDPYNGAISTDAAAFCTHLIAIPGGVTSFWTSMLLSGGRRVSFFNANKIWFASNETIPGMPGTPAYSPVQIPAGARYIGLSAPMTRFGQYDSKPDGSPDYNYDPRLKVFFYDPGGPKTRRFGRLVDAASLSPVAGMKMAILADSRFDAFDSSANHWPRICYALDATQGLTNVVYPTLIDTARSGRMLPAALTRYDGTPLVAADFADVAVCGVALGANDLVANRPVGLPSDTEAADTIYGHLFRIFKTLTGFNPYTRLFLTTPYYRNDVPLARQQSYWEAYRDFSRRNSVQLFDHAVESGVNQWNAATMIPDQVHATDNLRGKGGVNFGVVNSFVRFIKNDLTPPSYPPYDKNDGLAF
jgi:hypothetical protein